MRLNSGYPELRRLFRDLGIRRYSISIKYNLSLLKFIYISTMKATLTESISQTLGWAYFILWSLSFYPQVLHNHRRRSTDGFSIDFTLLNVLGLSAYTVSNACFLFSSVVRAQYAQRHPQSPEPTVQWNDFVYALHGALICCWICSQFICTGFWKFDSQLQRPSALALGVFWGCLGAVPLAILCVLALASWEWIDVVRGQSDR